MKLDFSFAREQDSASATLLHADQLLKTEDVKFAPDDGHKQMLITDRRLLLNVGGGSIDNDFALTYLPRAVLTFQVRTAAQRQHGSTLWVHAVSPAAALEIEVPPGLSREIEKAVAILLPSRDGDQ